MYFIKQAITFTHSFDVLDDKDKVFARLFKMGSIR
jgi:hypothetical protein